MTISKSDFVDQRAAGVPFNDLRRGFQSLSAELNSAVSKVLASGWYVHGTEHAAFENEFGGFVGAVECVGVANGTDALEIALSALDLPQASHVMTAANAGMYASTAIRRAGLTPQYADVDPESLLLTVEDVSAAMSPEVSAVVVTHLFGRMADVVGIRRYCDDRGLALVEDCAQAAGAANDVGRAGSFGDVATFSFYPTKNLGALGDAGAVVTRRAEIAERARELRQYGWQSKYHVGRLHGQNSRLDEVQAAVLRVRLPHLDKWNARRRAIIARYVEASVGSGVRVLPAVGSSHAGHLAVAVSADREHARARLGAGGIGTDIHYPVPDHQQKPFATDYAQVRLPVTEKSSRELFSLPCFPELESSELDRVCAILSSL